MWSPGDCARAASTPFSPGHFTKHLCPPLPPSVAHLQVLDVIKKSGTTTQLGLIVFLMIVLIVLAVFAFL